MEKIDVRVALLIIKEICKFNAICDDCPMFSMCINNIGEFPKQWKSIPEINIMGKNNIGFVLLMIKEMCKFNETCDGCPMDSFCTYNLRSYPAHWITDKIPDLSINIRATQKPES